MVRTDRPLSKQMNLKKIEKKQSMIEGTNEYNHNLLLIFRI